MRLTGGRDRGHPLVSPRGTDIRPTSDRVRQALFNILGDVSAARVLDLCAGGGTLGLEAISRGAESVHFVDASPRALKAITTSLERLHYADVAEVTRGDASRVTRKLASLGRRFELIFLDPPYGSVVLSETLEALARGDVVAERGRMVVEHDREDQLEAAYGCLQRNDERRYGRTVLTFYEHRGNDTL